MKIYNELESLGFFEWLSETHNLKDTDMTPEHLDELSLNDIHKTVCNSMALRWFREKYNLHAEITWSPSYEYEPGKWSDAIYEITFVDVSYTKEWKAEAPDMQRANGKQLTYEEAEQACLDKLIEICKK